MFVTSAKKVGEFQLEPNSNDIYVVLSFAVYLFFKTIIIIYDESIDYENLGDEFDFGDEWLNY